jgi:hypothetical protein
MPAAVRPITSGLFTAPPKSIIVLPVLFEGQVKAVIELASSATSPSCRRLPRAAHRLDRHRAELDRSHHADRGPAEQSQKLAGELQTSRANCSRPTSSSSRRPPELAERNFEVERKNQEIEQARRAVEEKARSWRSPRATSRSSWPT